MIFGSSCATTARTLRSGPVGRERQSMAKRKDVTRTGPAHSGSAGEGISRRRPGKALFEILLVEDSPFNRTITLAFLQHGPYRVDIAENGAVACKKFTAGHYDVVLMDRQMPVMDGLTATQAIRKWERANRRAPTPIIALTASTLEGDQEKCTAAGCTAFLTKPMKQEALLRAIREHTRAAPSPRRERHARNDRAIVRADPRIADLVPGFVQNRKRDVAVILDALERGDFKTEESIGHGMRGAGSNYGFQAISDIGAALERSAASADAAASRKWADKLASYLERVEIV